jgi:general stress protein 26
MEDELTMDEVRERIEDVRVAMVTVVERDGALSARPLTVQRITDEGTVEFLVDRDAGWAVDDQRADVALVDDGKTWVSVSGTAIYTDDALLVNELWDDVSGQFFESKDDAVVMRVAATTWSYWAAPNRLAQVFEMAKAFLMDRQPDMGTSGTIGTSQP